MTGSFLLVNATTAAQDRPAISSLGECTYDTCALRLENRRVLRGAEGRTVLRLGAWGADSLRPHLMPNDSALHYAAQFDRHYKIGTRLSTVGLFATGVMAALYVHEDRGVYGLSDRAFAIHAAGAVVSLGLLTYGGRRLDRALRGLSRAIWWSNRDLPR